MLTIPSAEPGLHTAEKRSGSESLFLDKLLRSYTQPSWRVGRWDGTGSAASGARAAGFDAAVADVLSGPDVVRGAAASLRQLGRLFLVASDTRQSAIDQAIDPVREDFSPIADLQGSAGERVIIAERTSRGGVDFTNRSTLREGVHLGAYKMSRYRTYHAMQAAVAQFLPVASGAIRDVIEIGDTNGVIRDMLGHAPRTYFQARYPEHDLQTLTKVASDSFDVFICDNTLEHIADPHAGLRQMHRVVRPGGWAILMLPFIAMAQDDDRFRFSPLALGEALRGLFPEGVIGSWGNTDAGCVYLRDNKWSRVLRTTWPASAVLGACVMSCRDSRNDGAPIVTVPCRNDRQHPIHVWALVRKPGDERTRRLQLPETAQFTSLQSEEQQASELIAAHAVLGDCVTVLGVRDGSLLDELARRGFQVLAIDPEPWRVNHARMRGHRALLHTQPTSPDVRDAMARSVALCDIGMDSASSDELIRACFKGKAGSPRVLVTANSTGWTDFAKRLEASPVNGSGSAVRAWARTQSHRSSGES